MPLMINKQNTKGLQNTGIFASPSNDDANERL